MPRYFIKQQGYIEDEFYESADDRYVRCIDVPEHVASNTGLFTPSGDPIMREPRPVGFGRDSEW